MSYYCPKCGKKLPGTVVACKCEPSLLPAALSLLGSIAINALVGFVFIVFAGAGAGNNGQGNQFSFGILIGVFVLLCLVSIIFLVKRKTTLAFCLPFATIPVELIAIKFMLDIPWIS
ncbi:hypothetical protein [Sulfuriferula thiophila]|jgi:hypothetical protein|uniref:hypothetical protein n=1 Tax=Sulfuriferula thiophila TaxID=1781211 RepID=UPI000F61258C|nr:hypothetical protein [Sulfuriferula thiophila]